MNSKFIRDLPWAVRYGTSVYKFHTILNQNISVQFGCKIKFQKETMEKWFQFTRRSNQILMNISLNTDRSDQFSCNSSDEESRDNRGQTQPQVILKKNIFCGFLSSLVAECQTSTLVLIIHLSYHFPAEFISPFLILSFHFVRFCI